MVEAFHRLEDSVLRLVCRVVGHNMGFKVSPSTNVMKDYDVRMLCQRCGWMGYQHD